MSTLFETFVDADAVCAAWLRDAGTDLDQRVYSSIPKSPTYPLATVKRIGGVPAEPHHLDAARIQIDVWGSNRTEAHTCAQQARVALMELGGKTVGEPAPAFVSDVRDDMGMSWQPDPGTGRDRVVFGIACYLHGVTGTS